MIFFLLILSLTHTAEKLRDLFSPTGTDHVMLAYLICLDLVMASRLFNWTFYLLSIYLFSDYFIINVFVTFHLLDQSIANQCLVPCKGHNFLTIFHKMAWVLLPPSISIITSLLFVFSNVETPTLSVKDKEEKAKRCEFVQGLLLSTILDDDLWRKSIKLGCFSGGLIRRWDTCNLRFVYWSCLCIWSEWNNKA